ncbi:MAG TPA: hypothetical protein VMT45_15745 [Thermoanaerobaculaceae bacterium]|nr:hypothetical protein [Thermoanaerobaculaceae bacterium]
MRMRALTVVVVVFALAVAVPAIAGSGPAHPPGHGGGHGHPPGHGGGYYYPHGYWGWSVGVGWPYWGWGGWWGPGWGWGPYYGYGWGAPVAYQQVPVGEAVPQLAVVDTDVEPEHARVILDGTLIGVADNFDGYPDYLYLKPGHYTIEFQLQGYASQKIEIDGQPGGYFPIQLKLERIKGQKAAPWYDRPEGMPVGRVFGPKTPPPAAAKPGPDTDLRPEFRAPAAAGSAATRSVAGAALDLRVTPLNAAVYIDAVLVGTGQELERLERGLAVSPGKHRIEVLAPGRSSREIDVEVKEGERQQVVVDLDASAGQT